MGLSENQGRGKRGTSIAAAAAPESSPLLHRERTGQAAHEAHDQAWVRQGPRCSLTRAEEGKMRSRVPAGTWGVNIVDTSPRDY